jgi:NAD(P)H-flavin reductase
MSSAAAAPMVPAPYRIRRARWETADTFTLELTPDGGGAPAPFAPGQFNMLYAFGVGEVPISIAGDPARPASLEHTTRVVGTVTRALGALARNAVVGVRGPYGSAWPLAEAEGHDLVLVAGGIGLAPLRPALHHIIAQRDRYGRVALVYGTRTPADLLYRREHEHWRSRGIDVLVTVDRAIGAWGGHVGVVTTLIRRAPFDAAFTLALVCGPEVMMRFTAAELGRRGVTADRIYFSLERNMKCAVGFCGHCQFGPRFLCKDGAVVRLDAVAGLLGVAEV